MTRLPCWGVVVQVLLGASFVGCSGASDGDMSPEAGGKVEKVVKPEIEESKNRLGGEVSPYLLQHVNNPVHWYPWGDQAFERAEREDKPIFLSIGYSTCHWCHVMEHESFEDEEVASLMNGGFVSIKVDREERPDIDQVYMAVCQMMTGGGGWPMTIVMTPDKKPFFAGTYFPKESRFGRKGLMDLLPEISEAWRDKREDLLGSADNITAALSKINKNEVGKEPGEEALHLGFRQLASRFDEKHGGFGKQPKFPTPHQLIFLLHYWRRTGNEGVLEMVEKTLVAMRRGGIFDHVGFGFHRYSTDPQWLVPHFEKMLYDQALLMYAYGEAYEATRKPIYAQTVREIAEYVSRDLTGPDGELYSAEDADSEGVEGKFYVWTDSQIKRVLGPDRTTVYSEIFGVKDGGNFESHEAPPNSNILHLSVDEGDDVPWIDDEERQSLLEDARRSLLETRSKRIRPLLDDKVLTDWNGLMIGALAKASVALDEPKYAVAASRAAAFLETRLTDDKGLLLHRFRAGESGLEAHLDDYAFAVFGLIELYQATFKPEYLRRALALNRHMLDRFIDLGGGGLYYTSKDAEQLIVRTKETYDGAIPSGNSVAFWNLLRLSRLTSKQDLEVAASGIAAGFGVDITRAVSAHSMFLVGLDFALGPSLEIVIAGAADDNATKELLRSMAGLYVPNKVVLRRPREGGSDIEKLAPFVASQPAIGGEATAYVCVDHACSFPTGDPGKMVELITSRLAVTGGVQKNQSKN